MKKAINTLINARSEKKALQSLLDGRKMSSETRELFLRAGILYIKGKKVKQNRELVRELIAKVKAKHAPISEYFGTGAGVKLQKIDSDMAARIILRLWRKGIGCLSLHDSFIVEEQNERELLSQMELAYYEKFSLPPMIDKKY